MKTDVLESLRREETFATLLIVFKDGTPEQGVQKQNVKQKGGGASRQAQL